MASKRQKSHGAGSNTPVREPARIKLTSKDGEASVNIGKISGNVFARNTHTETQYFYEPTVSFTGEQQTPHQSGNLSDSDSPGWEADSSESDSESERFFASQGVNMPNWREMRKNMKEFARTTKQMKNLPRDSVNYVHTMVVDENGTTTALDRNGKPVRLQPQQTPRNRSDDPRTSESTHSSSGRSSGSNEALPTGMHQPTTYEKQTQMFCHIMAKIPNRTVDEAVLRKISSEFGKGWRRVFRHLTLPDVVIDVAFQERGEVQETVFCLLVKWMRGAKSPDVRTLVEALVRAEQMQIIHLLES